MGTILAPTYDNITLEYHQIKVYSINLQIHALVSKCFESTWVQFLSDCQLLVKVN